MVAEVAAGMTRIPKNRAKQQLRAEDRRKAVIRMTAENVPLTEQAKELGVSYITVRRDRKLLMELARNDNKTEMQLWRDEHIAELQELREKLEDPTIKPAEKIALALAIIREDSKIKGTAAPTRSESLNVNTDVESLGPYRQFVLAARGLDEEQFQQLLKIAREMPRKPFVMVGPPKTSPLWKSSQLGDGTDAAS